MAEPQRSELILPRLRRRRWRWICVGLLLVFLVFIMRGPLFAPLVKRLVTTQLAKAIAGNVVITKVSGGWFTDARIQDIEVNGEPLGPFSLPHPLPHMQVKDLSATYGLGIFTGDSSALRTLNIDGLSLTLDLRAVESGTGVVPPLLAMLPMPLPSATVSGDIRLIFPTGVVLLADSRFTIAAATISLDTKIHVAQAEPMHVLASFTRTSADTVRLDHVVTIGATSVEFLELVLGTTRQELNAVLSLGRGKLNLHVDSKDAQLNASNVEMSAIPAAVLALLPVELGVLHGNVAGEIKAKHLPSGWDVAGSLRGDDLMAAGVGPFGVVAQWQLGVGNAQVSQALVSGPGGGQLSIENLAIDFVSRKFTGGVIHAQVPDVRGWLPVSVPLPPTPLAVTAALAVKGEVLAITNAQLSGGGVVAQVRGSLVAGPWHIEDADIDMKMDLAQVMKWIPKAPKLSGNVHTRVTGRVPLSIDPAVFQRSALTAEIQGDACMIGALAIDRFRVKAQTTEGHLQFTTVEVVTSNIAMSASGVWESSGSISLSGKKGYSGQATVERFSITFPGVTANLSAAFPLHFSEESWSAGPLRLTSDAGDVVLEVQHRVGFDLLHVEGHQLALNRLGLDELSGAAEVDMVLSGSWTQPSAHVQVKASDFVIGKHHAQVALNFTQSDRGITIREGQIDAGVDGRLAMSGTLPMIVGIGGLHLVPTGDLPATLDVHLPELNRWFPQAVAEGAAHLQLAIGLAQEPAVLNGELTFEKFRPLLPADQRPGRRHAVPLAINGAMGLHGDAAGMTATLRVNTDDQPIINGELRSLGAWDAATLNGGWRERSIIGEATLNGLNIGRFAPLIPGLQHLAGQAEGSISLAGTWQQPKVGGKLKLSGVEVKIATDIPTLSDGSAELELVEQQIRVVRGVIDMGGASVTAAGEIILGVKPQVNLRIDGTNALLMQRHDARLRASLALLLKGPLDGLELSGKAVVTNALFSPDVSVWQNHGAGNDGRMVPFEFIDPPLSTTRFDVKVSSAFKDENDGVRLATTLVRADADLDLHLRGSGAAPELIGRVTVRKGKIFLPFSTLNMTNGEILFPEGDPFHPRVNALANAQVRRYALTLQVDGPLADPQVRASGDGLDQRDALLLLTTGSTSSELTDENGQHAVIGRLGGWLGLEAWRMVEGPADPDTSPGIFERMTVDFGRKISETGKDTIDAQVEVTKPEERPSLLIYGERDRWDEYNAGIILRFRWGGDE
jgi:hypothetical protein